jgi:Co/Zn/Cd efflux system component
MLVFAVVGLIANLAGLLVLRAGSKDSLNVRGA